MDEYDRYMLRKQFTRMIFRIFFFGFFITLFFSIIFPRRVLVNEFGQPVDVHGRPIDRYGNPTVYRNQYGPPIHDPYNLGGVPRGDQYSPQAAYGRQYVAQSTPQGQRDQSYY
jgi:hypothetical protein